MAFVNPADSAEIFYGSSGDVRNEINAHLQTTSPGHTADENEIPGSLIVKSLAKATRLINAYLSPVYAGDIPVTTVASVPKFIDEISSDIAMFYVWRSAHVLLGRMPDEKKMDYYDQYVASPDGFLVQLSDSRMQLPEFGADLPDESNDLRSQARPPIFDLDDTLNQEVSPGLLEDIADDRESDS